METKIRSERRQSTSGKRVPFKVTINRDGSTAMWDGEILLREGLWHRLRGGVVLKVEADTVSDSVIEAFDRELETLDLNALNESYRN
jgi:hypothetical protein